MDQLKPTFLIWIVTTSCNLVCSHCYTAKFGSDELTEEEKLIVAKEAIEVGIKKINLTGGEVLLQKNILRLINYLVQNNVSLSIFTNGIALTEDIVKEIAKKQSFCFFKYRWGNQGNS